MHAVMILTTLHTVRIAFLIGIWTQDHTHSMPHTAICKARLQYWHCSQWSLKFIKLHMLSM